MKSRAVLVTLFLSGLAPVLHASPGVSQWSSAMRQPPEWYATDAARKLADTILLYQTADGGWPKNLDMSIPPSEQGARDAGMTLANFDNDATITQLRFLARVITAKDDAKYRDAFFKGLDYTLKAQYPNGGWPMFYPLRPGYFTHIDYNDNAMTNVMEFLRDVGGGEKPYAFVNKERREKSLAAVAKGIQCILKSQFVVNGKKTVWCAQVDETTLAPAKARAYELPSLSGGESVGLVRFLMSIKNPSPEVIAAVQAAVAWFKSTEIHGIRVQTVRTNGATDRVVVQDPNAPPIWARFYDLETGKPFFCGRDGVKKPNLADIEQERRGGYSYYGYWAAPLLETEYPAWEKEWIKPATAPAAATAPAPAAPAAKPETAK